MNKTLKKLFVCSASLMMMASLGTGIGNASARRVHHYRPRTHRVSMSSHALYEQGKKDGAKMARLYYFYAKDGAMEPIAPDTSSKAYKRVRNLIINHLALNHYNKSYQKGYMNVYQKKVADTVNEESSMMSGRDGLVAQARKVAHKSVKHHAVKKHARKYVKRNKHARRAKKATAKKHNVHKHTKARKSNTNKGNKRSSTATISEAELDKMPDSELDKLPDSVVDKMPESEYDKYMNRLEDSTPDNPDNIQDMTDGGKYYNWNQLEDILNEDNNDGIALSNGFASDALENKVKDSISYGLHNELYSPNQLKELRDNDTVYQLSPYLSSLANAKYDIAKTARP